MGIDFEDVLKKCFTLWTKDSKTWKYILVLIALGFVLSIFMVAIAAMLFGNILWEFIVSPQTFAIDGTYSLEAEIFTQLFSNFLIFMALIVPLFLLGGILGLYLQSLLIVRALQLNKLETDKFSLGKFFRLIGVWIFATIAALFSIYNTTLMILSIVFWGFFVFSMILIFLIPPVGAILLVLFILLFFLYLILVTYNGFRLVLATPIFLHKKIGITQAVKESWKMTKGNVFMILILSIVISFVVGILSQFVQLIGQFFGGIFDAVFGTVFIAIIFSMGFLLIINPLLEVIIIHLEPAIYAQLLKSRPEHIESQKTSKDRQFN